MGYLIDARLDDGRPRLQILDVESGAVRMAWESREDVGPGQAELKRLFWGLFLLSLRERWGKEKRQIDQNNALSP
jgi:hypothetical protein